MKDVAWHELDKVKYYGYGTLLFVGVRGLMHPINLVKTRLQVQRGQEVYTGVRHAFRQILKQEGPSGLFKGIFAHQLGLIGRAVYISTFEYLKSKFKEIEHLNNQVSAQQFNAAAMFLAGGASSIISQAVTNPLLVVSERLMVQDGTHRVRAYHGTWHAFRTIYAKEGLRGLYRGYSISLMTFGPNSAIWWSTYGLYMQYAEKVHQLALDPTDTYSSPSLSAVASKLVPQNETLRLLVTQGVGGAIAGTVAAVATNPLDVIRTRMQVTLSVEHHQTTFRHTAKQLLKEDGVRGLGKGLTARVLATAPTSILMIVVYELLKRLSVKS
eukprot:GILJ01008644.1.p1 GENE.GILJ01008644.1~~GILJ01008644.1.p1  ORF type:complete len:339 (-),score=32.25 GILJ01008644.1:162-1139(-)